MARPHGILFIFLLYVAAFAFARSVDPSLSSRGVGENALSNDQFSKRAPDDSGPPSDAVLKRAGITREAFELTVLQSQLALLTKMQIDRTIDKDKDKIEDLKKKNTKLRERLAKFSKTERAKMKSDEDSIAFTESMLKASEEQKATQAKLVAKSEKRYKDMMKKVDAAKKAEAASGNDKGKKNSRTT